MKEQRKRGLVLGKFAPLHRGHQWLIETALAEVDELVVVIYDAAALTDIPLLVRAGWIRKLYPSVILIEAWDGPQEVGYTPEIMHAHEDYIINKLAVGQITHFYSSEPYGEHMSRALGAVDRRVDEARNKFPVSGTQAREDPYKWRNFLEPLVYADHVVNVALLGAPGTGKTSLAAAMAAASGSIWMPEYGREYWQLHQVNRRLSMNQLVEIAEGHIEREDALLQQSNRYLFSDTNAITTATFSRYYHSRVPARLEELATQAVQRYDITVVCDDDIPYVDTWDRSGEANRVAFQQQVLEELRARKVPHFLVRGNLEQRVVEVMDMLKKFRKFSNVLSLQQGRRL